MREVNEVDEVSSSAFMIFNETIVQIVMQFGTDIRVPRRLDCNSSLDF